MKYLFVLFLTCISLFSQTTITSTINGISNQIVTPTSTAVDNGAYVTDSNGIPSIQPVANISQQIFALNAINSYIFNALLAVNTTPVPIYYCCTSISAGAGTNHNYNSHAGQVTALYQESKGIGGQGFSSTLGSIVGTPTFTGTWSNVSGCGPYQTSGTIFYEAQQGTSGSTINIASGIVSGIPQTVTIISCTTTSTSSYTISIDGISQGSFCGGSTSTITPCLASVTLPNDTSSHSVTGTCGAGPCIIFGFNSINSSGGGVYPVDIAQGGAQSGAFAASHTMDWLPSMPKGVFIYEANQNDDTSTLTTIAQTITNINIAYTNAVSAGNSFTIMVTQPDVSNDSCTTSLPNTCRKDQVNAILNFAALNNIKVIDVYHAWGGTYANALALGLFCLPQPSCGPHPSQAGANLTSELIRNTLNIPSPNLMSGEAYITTMDGIHKFPGMHQGQNSSANFIFDGYINPGFGVRNLKNGATSYLTSLLLAGDSSAVMDSKAWLFTRSGTNAFALNGNGSSNLYGSLSFSEGNPISSSSTIAPTKQIQDISGTSTISTITVPSGFISGCIELIPTGVWRTATGGNIANAVTAQLYSPVKACYNASDSLWYMGTNNTFSFTYVVPYTDTMFLTAATTVTKTLQTLPSNSRLRSVTFTPTTSFAGSGITSMSCSLGTTTSGNSSVYLTGFSWMQNTQSYGVGGNFLASDLTTPDSSLTVQLSCTANNNLGNGTSTVLTAGSYKVTVEYWLVP